MTQPIGMPLAALEGRMRRAWVALLLGVPLACVDTQALIGTEASDHRPVVATFRVK